jgi:tetratricopeptide (TPR) repeat protein
MSAENVDRPKRVFISATTHDLQSYRKLVTSWAKSKGYIPVVQEDFPAYPHDYSVKDVLRENLSPCDAVIHLAGLYYGAEPTGYVSPESRRSYTQLEYDLAKTLRRQLFVLIASEDYQPDDPITNQSQDHYQFQRQHRHRIRDSGGMRYPFSNHEQLSQQLQKIEVTGVADRPNNLPVVGSLFKGRDNFLLNMRSKVEGKVGSALVIATKHTIHGLGCVGKTRLAIEYANRYSEHYTALLFVVADGPESLRANIANLCGALRIDEPDPAKHYDAAIKWLQQNPGWFLIVDNVDTKEAASAVEESILGKLKEGHILVTSRLSAWRNRDLDPLELDVISEDASVELLLEGTDGQRKITQSDNQRALELAKRLGCLPLALQQAVGFISTRHCSFEEYLNRWDSAEKKVVEWHDELELKYPRSIATTWELSFDEMKPEGKKALRLICWLAPDPIPKALLYKVGQVPNSFDMEEGIAELEKYSFLRWVDDKKELVQVHGLVSDITRYRMSDIEKGPELTKSLETTQAFIKDFAPDDPATWPIAFRPCREHLFSLIRNSEKSMPNLLVAEIMHIFCSYLLNLAEYDEAEQLQRRSLCIRESCLPAEHIDIANSLNQLGILLHKIARIRESEQMYRRSLTIYEASLSPMHPGIVTNLCNLAALFSETNRKVEAEAMFRKILSIREASFGSNHPAVAMTLSHLSLLLSNTNRKGEAEPLARRALSISEASLDPDHPDIARSLNNLADLLRTSNQLEEAEMLLRRAIPINERAFGLQHPNVANLKHNLSAVIRGKDPQQAEMLSRGALSIYEAQDPVDLKALVSAKSILTRVLCQQDRVAEAREVITDAVHLLNRIRRESGWPHPLEQIILQNFRDTLSVDGVSADEINRSLIGINSEYGKLGT